MLGCAWPADLQSWTPVPTRFAGYYSEMVTKGADTLFNADSDAFFAASIEGRAWKSFVM